MKTPKLMALLFLTAAALSALPATWAQSGARAVKPHHAAKQAAAKRHPSARSTRTKIVPPPRPQGGGLPDLTPEQMQDASNGMRRLSDSSDLAEKGDADAARGDWAQASFHYKQALSLWPDYDNAFYGLGKCADAAGDTVGAIGYYRKAIYTTNPRHGGLTPGDGYATNNVMRFMEFVLLLDKAGQKQEALKVYSRAAYLLNYRDSESNGGKPYLKVLLPDFESGPDQTAYTPQRLQAMARVAISIEAGGSGGEETVPQVQEAVRLYPDSPITNFYLGKQLDRMQNKGAKAAYAKAAALGNEQVTAAAQEEMDNSR